MSVVFCDGEWRDWSSVRSITRAQGIDPVDLLHDVQQSSVTTDVVLNGRQGQKKVQARPIVGFEGDVYGIQLWVGALDEEMTPPRSCAATNWDIETLVVRQTLESYMMSYVSSAGFSESCDPGEFLRKVVQFDKLNELLDLCLSDGTRTQFDGRLSVLHDDGHLMAWRAIARKNAGPDKSDIRGISHDVTDTESPSIGPLTALRLTELASRPDDLPAVALVAYRRFPDGRQPIPTIAYWISPRPSYLAESAVAVGNGNPLHRGNLIHPDDYGEIIRAGDLLETSDNDREVSIRVRLLGALSDWVLTDLVMQRYPGEIGNELHIARFLPVQFRND
jgi:hypothetical protein